MKRFIVTIIAIAALLAADAQTHYVPHTWLGAHAGLTLGDVTFSPTVRSTFTPGFVAGLRFRFAEERHVGIMAELNVSQRGWQEDFFGAPFTYRRTLTYIDLPVMTHIYFGSRRVKCVINLGPQIGYMIGSGISSNFDYKNPASVSGFPIANRSTEQMKMEISNRLDYGITAGAGVEFRLGFHHALSIEGRYYYGLGNIFPSRKRDTFSASRTSAILISLGYWFRLK